MVLISATLISNLLQLLFTKIMTNMLNLSDYGILSLIISFSATISTFLLLEINSGLYRYTIEYTSQNDHVALRNIISSAFLFEIISSCICFFVLLIMNIFEIKLFNINNYLIMVIFALLLGVSNAFYALNLAIYTAKMNNVGYTLLTIVPNLTKIIIPVILIVFFSNNLFFILIGIILNNYIVNITTILFILNKYKLGKFSTIEIRRLLQYGFPIFCWTGFYFTLVFIIQSTLNNTISKEIVALFSLALSFLALLTMLKMAISYTYLGNILLIWDKDKRMDLISEYANIAVRIFSSLFFVLVTMFYVFSPQIIILMSHEGYIQVLGAIPLVIMISFVRIMKSLTTVGIHALKKQGLGAIGGFSSFIVAFLFSGHLILNFNLEGALLTLLLYEVILTFFLAFVSQRIFTIKFQIVIFYKIVIIGVLSIVFNFLLITVISPEAQILLPLIVLLLLFMMKMITISDLRSMSENIRIIFNQIRLKLMCSNDESVTNGE
ncbi:MAG: oligosaccharide flippase family protein [Asgard group archaeon]|nr:oligosaccharide flippase family protein [Asgard group archaeon]